MHMFHVNKQTNEKQTPESFTVPVCLMLMDVSGLCFPPSYSGCLHRVLTTVLTVLTLLSCFPQTLPSSSSTPPHFLPSVPLPPPFCSFIVCLFSLVAPFSFSTGLPISRGHSLLFLCVEFLCNDVEGVTVRVLLLSIYIFWVTAWGRLVLVGLCVCVICRHVCF